MMTMTFRAAAPIWEDSVKVVACMLDAQGHISHVAAPVMPFTIKEHTRGAIVEPTFQLAPDEAQALMNALWEAGIRPKDFTNPNGEIRRLEAHLADMQKLAMSRPLGIGSSGGA